MKCLGTRCQIPTAITTITESMPSFGYDNNPVEMITQGVAYPPSFGFKQNNNSNKLRGTSS
jgi:hypothetical protein